MPVTGRPGRRKGYSDLYKAAVMDREEALSKVSSPSLKISWDEAVERLSCFVYEKLEHLDPTDDRAWPELSERERELYRIVVRGLLDRRSLVLAGLERPKSDHDLR
ncbi:MAG: hypothetical protein K0R61_3668 [Microvirga sp.]|jgi:hypothetical protein|nr:hypothetical protein [Microvirga sp.]